MNLQKGQKVRLNERGVRVHVAWGGTAERKHPNWKDRVGTIARITASKKNAVIVWDGNKSLSDAIPVTLVEPILEKETQ